MTTSSCEPPKILCKRSLELDEDVEEVDEDQLYRFMPIPSNTKNSEQKTTTTALVAYGGDNGNVCLWDPVNKKANKILQRFDDEVRAMAISPDGTRMAVGLETGSTRVYTFDDYNPSNDGEEHPFLVRSSKDNGSSDVGGESEDMLMSQEMGTELTDYWTLQVSAPIRDLLFLEKDSSLWLVVASEEGLYAVDTTSRESLKTRVLEHEVEEHHDNGGIRGVSFQNGFLTTLAMDGRLCVWDWKEQALVTREKAVCISKRDVGEINGASPFDRACRPTMSLQSRKSSSSNSNNNDAWVATPGQLTPCIRKCGESGNSKNLEVDDLSTDGGHIDITIFIVPLVHKKVQYWISSGRDARLVLWKQIDANDDDDNDDEDNLGKLVFQAQVSLESSPATDLCVDGTKVYCACAKGTATVVDWKDTLQSLRAMKSPTKSTAKVETETTAADDKDLKEKDTIDAFDEDESNSENEASTKSTKKLVKKGSQKTKESDAIDFDDDDDDDDDVDFSGPITQPKAVRFIDEEADEDDDENDNKKAAPSQNEEKEDMTMTQESTDTNLEDPEPVVQDTVGNVEVPVDGFDNVDDDDDDDMRMETSQYMQAVAPTIPPQPAFSPSSTPLDLSRRFLCWNHIGAITMLQGPERNTIDISFSDSAFKRPISFTDNTHFLVGSLGEDGGIFASDLQEDDDDDDVSDMEGNDALQGLNMSERTKRAIAKSHKKRRNGGGNTKPTGSSIFFYRFETFGNIRDKDWYLTLPDGERVLGSACGEGWASVMTSRRFLRLFTSGGNQAQVVWLKGDPVTMTGRSKFLAVFYHESNPLPDGTQKIGYTLWDASSFKVITEGSVSCISKGAKLTWVGFSNDCSLMAMDSDGMLSMLTPCNGGDGSGEMDAGAASANSKPSRWTWSPMLDTIGLRKSVDDHFWPVSVYNGKLVCVPLKGGNTYPDAARRPVTSALGLRMPLARAQIGKNSILEELSVRSNMALAQKKVVHQLEDSSSDNTEDFEREYLTLSAQVDKVTLKLFAATVDAGKLERALDLVDRLHLEKSYDLAIQLADRHRKLADFIEDARDRRFAVEEEDEDEDDDGEDYDSPNDTNTFIDRLASTRQISPEANGFKIKRGFGSRSERSMKKPRFA